MRNAGFQRAFSASAVLTDPAALVPREDCLGRTSCEIAPAATSDPPDTHVLLSPAGTFVNGGRPSVNQQVDRHRQLAIAIRQRIESRLLGRVRDLTIRISGNTVVLEGKCATYYTKQLAQHAALGILEDEHLDNNIVVALPK
jgi:hypothetical protein